MPIDDPDISVIVTTCNRAEHLRLTLEAMAGVRVPEARSAELVVVDNASKDATAEVIKACRLTNLPVRYLHEPRPGQSRARNFGMAQTRGRAIVFTDDDVRPCADWLSGMVEPLLSGKASVVLGGVVLAPHLLRPWMEQSHRGALAETARIDSKKPGELIGANMGFLRSVLDDVPAFDPELGPGAFGFADDTLFSLQLQRAGHTIYPALDAVVEHHFDASRLTREHWLNRARNGGRSWGYIGYHWEHVEANARKFYLKRQLRLALTRRKRRGEWNHAEGAPEWEITLLHDVYYWKQYLVERKKPRHYEKFGLVKREDTN